MHVQSHCSDILVAIVFERGSAEIVFAHRYNIEKRKNLTLINVDRGS